MLDKASAIEERFAELERKLSDPATLGNQREYARLAKERSQLSEAAHCAREYIRIADEIAGHKSILDGDDADLRELAKAELPTLQKNLDAVEEKLKELLTPRDPNDEKNVILEIRAGTGGEEASLFAGDLFRMYTRYAERHGFKLETLSMSDTGLGGIKEVIALVNGTRRILAPQVRRRGASRAARAGDRRLGPHPHLGGHGRGDARSRRRRGQYQRGEGPAHRRDARVGTGRAERQHHRLGGANHAYPERDGDYLPRRKIAAQEQGAAR